MAEDRWNDSRQQWEAERRRERERMRMQDREDYGQADFSSNRGQRDYRGPTWRFDEHNDDTGYRSPGNDDRVYTKGSGRSSSGLSYGSSGRFDEMSQGYRDFDSRQQRIHRGDYDPDRYTPNPREGRGEEARSWWDRTQDEVSSWFGDESARRRREWDERQGEYRHAQSDEYKAEHRGRGPKGYRRSDERMTEDINDRLTDDAYLDASDIDVKVKDGEATLSGTIQRREDKRRAEDLAEAVSGITHVQNNLRVKRDDTYTPSTGDITL